MWQRLEFIGNNWGFKEIKSKSKDKYYARVIHICFFLYEGIIVFVCIRLEYCGHRITDQKTIFQVICGHCEVVEFQTCEYRVTVELLNISVVSNGFIQSFMQIYLYVFSILEYFYKVALS